MFSSYVLNLVVSARWYKHVAFLHVRNTEFGSNSMHDTFNSVLFPLPIQVHYELRKWLRDNAGAEVASSIRIIYGGKCSHFPGI